MAAKTNEELLELGRKVEAQNEKAKAVGHARGAAVQKLIAAHRPEYDGFLADEKKKARI